MAFFESHGDRVNLYQHTVVSSWSAVIGGFAGHGDKFLDDVEQAMTALAIPNVVIKRQEVELVNEKGWKIGGGGVRVCLMVYTKEPHFGYSFYFSAQDLSKHLVVSRLIQGGSEKVENMFHKEIGGAYLSLVNGAMMAVVEKLAAEANQDFSKIENQSKGIIDIV